MSKISRETDLAVNAFLEGNIPKPETILVIQHRNPETGEQGFIVSFQSKGRRMGAYISPEDAIQMAKAILDAKHIPDAKEDTKADTAGCNCPRCDAERKAGAVKGDAELDRSMAHLEKLLERILGFKAA